MLRDDFELDDELPVWDVVVLRRRMKPHGKEHPTL